MENFLRKSQQSQRRLLDALQCAHNLWIFHVEPCDFQVIGGAASTRRRRIGLAACTLQLFGLRLVIMLVSDFWLDPSARLVIIGRRLLYRIIIFDGLRLGTRWWLVAFWFLGLFRWGFIVLLLVVFLKLHKFREIDWRIRCKHKVIVKLYILTVDYCKNKYKNFAEYLKYYVLKTK